MARRGTPPPGPPSGEAPAPRLLASSNPQIPKGYGDAPVQAWIAAAPGWKSLAARQIDALVVGTLPGLRKAVKWNSPLYGVEEGTWFLSLHCMTRYIKVAFFKGGHLVPLPPIASKQQDVRYLHLSEDTPLDAAQFVDWVRQASALPGERL